MGVPIFFFLIQIAANKAMPHKGIKKYIYEEKICEQIVKSIFWTLTPFFMLLPGCDYTRLYFSSKMEAT
jgi:hypothetical protein